MKSVFTFLYVMVTLLLINGQSVNGQEYWNRYFVNEDFDGLMAAPSSLTVMSGTSGASLGIIGRSGGSKFAEDKFTIDGGSGGGNRGVELAFASTSGSDVVHVEFDWIVTAGQVTNKNAVGVYLLGSNSNTADAYTDAILCLYTVGSGTHLHCWNKDLGEEQQPVFSQGGALSRCDATDATKVDSINAKGTTNIPFSFGKTYRIYAELDFVQKKVVVLTITDKDEAVNTETLVDLPFISSEAADLSRIGLNQSRGSCVGNGNTVQNMSLSLDNFQVYEKVLSEGKAKVTVSYKDRDGNRIKPDKEFEDQEVGLEFKILENDKETFTSNGYYYTYDAVKTGSEVVMVDNNGSSITIYFKGSMVHSGTYTWTGAESAFWDELDNNFAIEGNNTVSYQQQNGVIFGESASKEITVLGNKNLGSCDLTINSAGYNLSGDGVLSGDGTLFVNASATIGVENKLAGGLVLTQGTLEIKNAAAATKYVVEAGTGLNVNAATLSAPIEGNGGALTIIPTYQAVTTSAITGVEVLNYELQHQGKHNRMNYSGMPRLNNSFAGQLNVTTALDSAYFGTTIAYPDAKINLGDNVYLAYSDSPVKPDDVPEGTIVSIGELTGTEKSGISGALLRKLTYRVGGLNTDATFAGSLYRLPGDGWYNPVHLNITKEGTGEWTLTGNSPEYAGELAVENGTLCVDGTIGSPDMMVPQPIENPDKPESDWTKTTTLNAAVADGATLTGNGHIYALNTTVNGTVAGSLTFEGTVQLEVAAKTKIVIDGNTSDKITVKGDFYVDGALEIEVKSAPTTGTYTIFDAPGVLPVGDPENGFTSIAYPTGDWSFDIWTGVLTYNGGYSSIDTLDTNKEVVSKEYFDLVGKLVVEGNYEGLVIEKVRYTDGSVSLSKKLLTKN